MKNTLKLLVLTLALAIASAISTPAQQFTLTQTTLTADVTAAATTFQLASVTGISGQGGGGVGNSAGGGTGGPGTGTGIFIDAEYASVISVNVAAKTVFVMRGLDGTKATAHKASNMVLFGNPNAFVTFDPAGTCVLAQIPAQPTVNVNNGRQWLCSTITLTWVPGFNNGQSSQPLTVTTLVASAAGAILPSGPLFHVNGTAAVTGFTIPVGCNATVRGGCQFTIIPDAVFTWTAAGNIALAGSAVVNKALTFTWDATNSKWIPSYIA